jgi:hypothetical protein
MGRMIWAARARNLLLTLVVVAPIALSAQNIIGWAADAGGLGLDGGWPLLVFFALDAAAGVCVLMTLILAATGERAGAFGPLVWVFALASAFAGYRHGTEPDAPRDTWWFFPLMSVLGPVLLHLVLGYVRRSAQTGTGRRLAFAPASAYRLGRWIPGVGAFAETYCAWRVGRLEGITTPAQAIDRYRQLCPDGGWRVLAAMRTESAKVRASADTAPDTQADTDADIPADITPDTNPNRSADIPADTNADMGSDTERTPERTSRRAGKPSTAALVGRLRQRHPEMSTADMARRLGVTTRTVRRYLTPTAAGDPATA